MSPSTELLGHLATGTLSAVVGAGILLLVTWDRQVSIAAAEYRMRRAERQSEELLRAALQVSDAVTPRAIGAGSSDDHVIGELLAVDHVEACCTGHGDEPCSPDSGIVPPFCCPYCPDQPTPDCCDSHDICNDGEPCNPVEHALPCCVRCPAWTHVLSDEPHHDDEDAPADDTDRAGVWRVLLGLASDLVDRVHDWLPNLLQQWRERNDVGSGEQATEPGEALRQVLAASGYELDEPEPVRIVRTNRYRDPGMTGAYPLVKVVGDKAAGRHRAAPEPEMPAVNAAIPAQRTEGE